MALSKILSTSNNWSKWLHITELLTDATIQINKYFFIYVHKKIVALNNQEREQ